MIKKRLVINGLPRTLLVNPDDTLAKVLREQLLLTGCKIGCNQGQCGTCTVIVDGKAVRSCIMKMGKIKDDTVIETIEGIGSVDNLHPLQVAWMGHGCAQCGFCSPGFYHVSKSASGGESFSYQGGSASLVPGAPESVPLYRI